MGDRGAPAPEPASDETLRERVAHAAHDLRSPLNTILTWAQVLEQSLPPGSGPAVDRALTGIRDGVARQVGLIEQLLEASRAAPAARDGDA